MCITPKHFPKESFIVKLLERTEEKIGHEGENYEIHFERHAPHKAHFPNRGDVNDALARVLMALNIIYKDKSENECFIFDQNEDVVDHAAKALIALSQFFLKKNNTIGYLLDIPTVGQFKLRIYHIVLDMIVNVFIDHLIGDKKASGKIQNRIKVLEEYVTEFVLENVSAKDFFGKTMH